MSKENAVVAIEAAELVLIAHQRRDNSSCLCGWAEIGKSHPGHQAAMLTDAGLLTAAPRQWGVRDRDSLHIAGHPSEESANATADARPEWYEVVSRPMPGLWTAK